MAMRLLKIGLTLLVVLLLSAQVATTFRLCRYGQPYVAMVSDVDLERYCAPRLWPFLTYPMYADPHYPGDEIDDYALRGRLEDSTWVRIRPADLDVNFWIFQWEVLPAVREEESAALTEFIDKYEASREAQLDRLLLVNRPVAVTEDGLEPKPERVVKRLTVDPIRAQADATDPVLE